VACGGGALLLALDALSARLDARALAREVAWGIILLLAGLNVVIEGLVQSGVTSPGARALDALADWPALGPPIVAVVTAALSNAINNLPMALIVAAALEEVEPMAAHHLALGAIIGIDLGPNLTTAGSFATLLWLMLLRRRGVDVSPRAYARVGIIVTVPALLAAILALALTNG
jgi:arsenical pump membrane protein